MYSGQEKESDPSAGGSLQMQDAQLKMDPSSGITQEKIQEYANELNRLNARVKQNKSRRGDGEGTAEGMHSEKRLSETPATEKLNLLRLQMEQNKAKIAERDKNQKGIEQMVTELKAKLDDSQTLINQTPINVTSTIENYSQETSSQELYKILTLKDKHIIDLTNRIQKLEGTVLDLQENIKEKDQVIDARTKAITLMSESLSKKGKSTLDALEETKEQMRQMQANFVQLEAQMRIEKQVLQTELHNKNVEIIDMKERLGLGDEPQNSEVGALKKKIDDLQIEVANLKECNERLKEENVGYIASIGELESKLNKMEESGDESEINKLKKQLDESNKTMIKLKAQSKSKIKELTKKIEAFKKVSDANAELVKLETENSKLKSRIEELETNKDGPETKIDLLKVTEYEEKLQEQSAELKLQSEALILKEEEIKTLKDTINQLTKENTSLNEKLDNISQLQNTITTQIDSIAFEENIDQLTKEKETLSEENRRLRDTLELIKKEKLDLSAKLESCLQENAELLDKLEKLSAEKVSSAESIEIVEGLTQQEKLELESFQKNIGFGNLEQNLELNESVGQLNEETADLLQKIELFTSERKEVMEKMEVLVQENVKLKEKLEELGNNRDVLAETYEQLQNEKEALDKSLSDMQEIQVELREKITALERENEDVKKSIDGGETNAVDNKESELLKEEIENLKSKIEKLEKEKEELSNMCKDFQDEIDQYEEELEYKEGKILTYQVTLNENMDEMIANAKTINEMNANLEAKTHEMTNLGKIILDLERNVAKLENDNRELVESSRNIDVMENQLKELKDIFNDNLEQIQKYEEQMQENTKIIGELKQALNNLSDELNATRQLVDVKNVEIARLSEDLLLKEKLFGQMEEKEKSFRDVCEDLKEKCLKMQQQIGQNSDAVNEFRKPMEDKIEELTNKNKEQLEKMKKLAANLKKKTQALNELEVNYKTLQEKHETEIQEKQEQLKQNELKIKSLLEQLFDLEEALNATKQQPQNSNQLRIQQLETVIESQESDLAAYKEKLGRLEEVLAVVEERRASLEQRNLLLGSELEEKSLSCEEIMQTESELERRLQALLANDRVLERQLEDLVKENQELLKRNGDLEGRVGSLEEKVRVAQNRVEELSNVEEQSEKEKEELLKKISLLQDELKQMKGDYELKKKELESADVEMHEHYLQYSEEKKGFLEKIQVLSEELNEAKTKESSLKEQIEKLERYVSEFEEAYEKQQKDVRELQLLKDKMKSLETSNESLQDMVVSLEKKNSELQSELQKEPIEDTVNKQEYPQCSAFDSGSTQPFNFFNTEDEKAKEFEDSLRLTEDNRQSEQLGTFNWPQQTTKEINSDLQQKIKALEFMLYNSEKDKDEALFHCQELVKELARFVYEKDTTDLKSIEFQPVKPLQPPSETPIIEDVCVATDAYKCYPQPIETQVIKDTTTTSEEHKQLQQIEFTGTKNVTQSSTAPIVEDPSVKTFAYQCFGENDDGWGCGQEEAKLEAAHVEQSSAEFHEKIRQLEAERERHLEEIKQLQVKTGKLVKKLKEFKAKNEQLQGLDTAIVDEYRDQINGLEKKLGEVSAELQRERLEKANLAKRVEVLTAGNERLVEMKEKQDLEVMLWQQKNRELTAKLEEVDWGDDGFEPPKQVVVSTDSTQELQRKIEELNGVIKELTLDNEELQSLLEEQRNLRINAEMSLKSVSVVRSESEFVEEKNALERKLEDVLGEKKRLQDVVNDVVQRSEVLGEKLETLLADNLNLQKLSREKDEAIEELRLSVQKLESTQFDLIQKEEITREYENKLRELYERNQMLITQLQETEFKLTKSVEENSVLTEQIQQLKDELQQLTSQNVLLTTQFEAKTSETEELLQKLHIEDLKETPSLIAQLNEQIEQLTSRNASLTSQLEMKLTETEELLQRLHIKERDLQETPSLVEQIQQLTTQNASLMSQLEAKTTEIEELLQKLQTKEQYLQETHSSIAQLNQQIQQLTTQNASLTSQLEAKTTEDVPETSSLIEQIQQLTTQNASLTSQLEAKTTEIEELLNRLHSKEQDLQETPSLIAQLNEEWAQRVEQRGFDVAESWKLHLEMKESEFARVEKTLRDEMMVVAKQCEELVKENESLRVNVDGGVRERELKGLRERLGDVELRLKRSEEVEMELRGKLVGYETEVADLKDELEKVVEERERVELEKDEKIESLRNVIGEKEKEIEDLKMALQEYQKDLSSKEETLETCREKESIILELKNKLEETEKQVKQVLQEKDDYINSLNCHYQEIQDKRETETLSQISAYQQELSELTKQLQWYQHQLENYTTENSLKDSKINEINQTLQQSLEDNKTQLIQQQQTIESLKTKLIETENHYESILTSKQTDIENLQQQNQTTLTQLEQKTTTNNNQEQQLTELRDLIETQVLKIEELKNELFAKSNDYDALLAEVDMHHQEAAAPFVPSTPNEDELLEPVSRAELDLALYMLHQRDVRCEELTVELMQLLEERDTLQLRLSNVIREKEELKRKVEGEEEMKAEDVEVGAVGPEVEAKVEGGELAKRLSELKSVGYKKDKTIVDEQQLRRLQELSLMQQHRDAAAKLPPEAAARLVGASYTLSRDVQSPSKVLMNWLWGKSVPKVNDV